MQVGKRGGRGTRLRHLHAGAGGVIEHPRRNDQDLALRNFDICDLAVGPRLKADQPQPASKMRVPAITDFDILPDTGRMNG